MDQDERESLARRVVDEFRVVCVKLAQLETDIRALWREFDSLPPGEKILGCRNKKEFCTERLGRTPRAVRYMLNGGNERRGENVSPVRSPSLTEDIWRQVRSFTSESRTLVGITPTLQEFLTHAHRSDRDRENLIAAHAAIIEQIEVLTGMREVIEDSGILEEPCLRPQLIKSTPALLVADVLKQSVVT